MSVAASTKAELTLLRIIARVELTPGEQKLLQELAGGALDWEYLLSMAGWHGLEPLLFLHLNEHAAGVAPAESMHALREDCRRIARRNLILATKLQGISAHLRARKVEHIVFKGPLLAEVYYGDWSLRVSYDLDLIVPPEQLVAARDALGEIGFSDKNRYSEAQQSASFRYGFEHPFIAEDGTNLDVHWRVVPKFMSRSLDMAGIWQRVTMARLLDCDMPTFCPEDLLLALCLHAGQHEWVQISHFCDLAQLLLVHPQMDWDIVRSHLGDSNTKRIVSVSLYLLRQHWDAALPESMMTRITSDPHVARLAHRIQTEMWPSPESAETQSNFRWLLDRTSAVDVGDRLRLMLGIIFNPTLDDFDVFKLPQNLSSLYPGLRALRLSRKYASFK